MSTAARVPETWELTGDDARKTLLGTGRRQLLQGRVRPAARGRRLQPLALARVRHVARARPGTHRARRLRAAFGDTAHRPRDRRARSRARFPGRPSQLLTDAVAQAQEGRRRTTATSRFFSVSSARSSPGRPRWVRSSAASTGSTGSSGTARPRRSTGARSCSRVCAGSGLALRVPPLRVRTAERHRPNGFLRTTWPWLRWPLGLLVATLALAALLRWSPRRRQPAWSWLLFGAGVCVAGWVARDAGARGRLSLSSSFGTTYGPLAGSSRSSSGRSSRRSRSSTGPPLPPSSRRCARASRSRANPRRRKSRPRDRGESSYAS